MIDRTALLTDLKREVRVLEDDIRGRLKTVPEMSEHLIEEYRRAKAAERTADAMDVWQEEIITQAAVAWVLGCVFVRFMEDNGLIDPLLSGPGERRQEAEARSEEYFNTNLHDTERDYLLHVFNTVAKLPAVEKLFDKSHNVLWHYTPSGDAAKALLRFWRRIDPESGTLHHDFTDEAWNTRFLGDLYQDLSESARKRYALLQTPEFVEEFILDRTLNPALDEFGLEETRMIDPTCGSGHFLLGAFQRLLDRFFRRAPAVPQRELVQRALDGVYGVDINPFAVAIARFRLLVEALRASKIHRMSSAPAYRINVTAGDSLLHGRRFDQLDLGSGADQLRSKEGIRHAFEAEDLPELNRMLGQQYHAVVGNPPYITPKNKALNALYRKRYSTCHRQYSLGVPFTERFFQLAVHEANQNSAGYVGMITANSFMKREFGKKLIEEFLPQYDLTHIVDTSRAYIPGHGTPTAILFARMRVRCSDSIRTVVGLRGESKTPEDPTNGKVWRAIVDQVDASASESEWISAADLPADYFRNHPWSLAGESARKVFSCITGVSAHKLHHIQSSIGFYQDTHADSVFVQPSEFVKRLRLEYGFRAQVRGEEIRDWSASSAESILFPFDAETLALWDEIPSEERWDWLFRCKTSLWARSTFGGKTYRHEGRKWFDYHQFPKDRVKTPTSIAFAFVATHNHFVLDRRGKVFNRSAPVIRLPADATDDDYLGLLALLNSSTACFWMKQVFHDKGVGGIGGGIGDESWEPRYEHAGTGLGHFPLTDHRPFALSKKLDELAAQMQSHLPSHLSDQLPMPRRDLDSHRDEASSLLGRMMALQEELDWRCYRLYGVTEHDLTSNEMPPEIALGERAFEIVMARKMAADELETMWFSRHGSTPVTQIPDRWPAAYRDLIARRIELIESDRFIRLLEQPEYKRRWNQESWESREQRALRSWLLERLESDRYWTQPKLRTARQLADQAATDDQFMQVAELYVGQAGFEVAPLIAKLVEEESVPAMAVLRYKAPGLRKRAVWERTWAQQRNEDRLDADVAASLIKSDDETADAYAARLKAAQDKRKKNEIGDISVPPKYKSAEFSSSVVWRHRGALDVPRERFFSLPFASPSADGSLLVGWAGWNSLQRAQAIATRLSDADNEGWSAEQMVPLLVALRELLPWIKQWHNDVDPEYDQRLGDVFEGFLASELQRRGLTEQDLVEWKPAGTGRTRKRKTKKKTT